MQSQRRTGSRPRDEFHAFAEIGRNVLTDLATPSSLHPVLGCFERMSAEVLQVAHASGMKSKKGRLSETVCANVLSTA